MNLLPRSLSLFEIYSDESDVESISKVLRRGKYWAEGPEIKIFEESIAKYVGAKYALVFNSGTSALHAALLAHCIKSGDEVIVPSFTFVSTANTIILTGARPVFAEIEDSSYGLDSESVAEKITDRTKAIIPVHYGGAPCKEIRAITELASEKDIPVIEDAAEALGSRLGTQKVGSFGDSAMFSFCQNKVITTGEGGAVVTNSEDVLKKMKLVRSHGRQEGEVSYFEASKPMNYVQLGYNYRMPTICAALGIAQLNKLEKLIELRRERALKLNLKLRKIPQLKTPEAPDEALHIYQMYTIRLSEPDTRDRLQEYLTSKKIMTKIYFPPIHLEPFYRKQFGYKNGELPITEGISKRVLTLPMHPKLTNEDLDYIVKQIYSFFR